MCELSSECLQADMWDSLNSACTVNEWLSDYEIIQKNREEKKQEIGKLLEWEGIFYRDDPL